MARLDIPSSCIWRTRLAIRWYGAGALSARMATEKGTSAAVRILCDRAHSCRTHSAARRVAKNQAVASATKQIRPAAVRRISARTSDWRGRYWARWGDAVTEAGFEPNPMNARLADEQVIESVASLTRELGRFPTYAELTLASRSRDNFPSFSVVRRRGGLAPLAASLQTHFEDRGETDLASLCASALERLRPKTSGTGLRPSW